MKIDFCGLGGEYCVGKLNDIELNNIEYLLKRFDKSFLLNNLSTGFNTEDIKSAYFDFDDAIHFNSVLSNCYLETIIDGEEITYSSDLCNIELVEKPSLEDGFYLSSHSSEKGLFFTIQLDNIENFDISKVTLRCIDLINAGFSDIIVSEVLYDDKPLELNADNYSSTSKYFEQTIIYVENGMQYDGIKLITEKIKDYYNIIPYKIYYDLDNNTLENSTIIDQYLEFIEAYKKGYLLTKTNNMVIWASPFLYEHYDKKDVDKLWLRKENIIFAFKNNLEKEIPNDILKIVIDKFPEWLI